MRGEGRTFQRGKMWWIAYYGPGENGAAVEIRESTGSEKETVAKRLLRVRTRQVANHKGGVQAFQGPTQERLAVADLINSLEADYRRRGIKSLRQSINHGKPIREFFGLVRAVAVTPDLVREYIEQRKTDGRSNAKVNRETEILSAAFNLALKEERIARRPYIPHLAENNARTGFFEADEHARLLEHLESPLDDVARLAYVCGWRQSEIRLLHWENVDRAAKEVRLFDSKNGEGRVLPLDDETWMVFERRWIARQYETAKGTALSEFVFHEYGQPVSESKFKRVWGRACKKAKLVGKLFHDYRRTAARNMLRAGIPQAVAMKITGHLTDSMFRRYSIVSVDDKRAALKKQVDFLKGEPASNVAEFRKPDTDKTRTIGQ